jgi:hypothetical protein
MKPNTPKHLRLAVDLILCALAVWLVSRLLAV